MCIVISEGSLNRQFLKSPKLEIFGEIRAPFKWAFVAWLSSSKFNSDDPEKKHVQTASGWYDIFRYGCGFLCLSTIFSVGSSQHAVAPLWYHGANSDASSVSTCVPCTCMDNAMIWRCYGSKFPGGDEWKFGCWDDLVDDIWVRDLKTGWLWRDIWHRCIMMYHCSLALLYPFMFLFYPFLIDIVPL